MMAYASVYLAGTATKRSVEKSDNPALAWLKHEYRLDDAQFARLCALYRAYRPKCMEMCRQVDATNAQITKLIGSANAVTPQLKRALAEAGQLRVECETTMIEHFYSVAKTMPPPQAKRFLAWVQRETLNPGPMTQGPLSPPDDQDP